MPDFSGDGAGSFDEFLARILQGQRMSRQSRPVDITRLLSRRTHQLVEQAGKYAVEHGHNEVDALHLLRLLATEELATSAIRSVGADPNTVIEAIEQRLPENRDERPDSASLTGSAQRVLLDAHQVARAFGSTYIDPEHLFFAFVLQQESAAGQLLAGAGVTQEALRHSAEQTAQGSQQAQQGEPGAPSGQQGSLLEQFGTDLTEQARSGGLDPVIGRSAEIEQTIEILARRTKNNPVLIGEAGVGKTAIAEGLAQAIATEDVPAQLHGKRVVSLDLPGMIAGTRYRGDFEERLTGLLDEIANTQDETIVFLDELHTVVGAGGSGESGGMDAGNILKPRLARGELHMVGATTLHEYRTIEKDPALERRFQPVTVDEPSVADAVQILAGLQTRYAEHHAVTYTEDAVRAAVELSDRYLTDRQLPDKAIDLIDQAGARRSLKRGGKVDVAALRTQRDELEQSKQSAVAEEDFERAGSLRDEIEQVNQRINEVGTAVPQPDSTVSDVVDVDDIAEVISRATGIPAARLTETEKSRLAQLEDELHQRVIGQHDAVGAISRSIRRSRTGMADPSRPMGSFLFLGPTGVGKTELAKSLAHTLFDDEAAMVRLDMSEFGERHTVSRLVGAPPGYVGYDEAGQLTEAVRRRPYSVILLDEVEKAHGDVFNLLLQVLDDGRLTDGQGRTVDFRNTVLIMTSNIGSEVIAGAGTPLGFTSGSSELAEQDLQAKVNGQLREVMRPEFLNRIDETVLFRRLDAEQLRTIVRLQLTGSVDRLAAQGITLEVDEAAVAWIAETGYQPEYGARPLRRVIQRQIDDRIADALVAESVGEGGTIEVTVDDGELQVRPHPARAPAAA